MLQHRGARCCATLLQLLPGVGYSSPGKGWEQHQVRTDGARKGNNMEILCKAATIAQESQSCHRYLEGIYHNLLSLVWGTRKPCSVAAGSTTSLKNFLKQLHQVLQEEYKSRK
uniref:Uncharacterized protein n=1 Tax=Corvus moneduloides TaxID=1196302 RepID=A0A8U7NPM4_CORMO